MKPDTLTPRAWARRLVALLAGMALLACTDNSKPVESAAKSPPAATATRDLDAEKLLNLYLFPDYLAESLIPDFEKETGIKVNYENFENYETLHAKLVAGNTGYDIVVPGSLWARTHIDAGFYQPVDKTRLSNYANLDASILDKLAAVDPGNTHLVPWAWGYTTVGINRSKLEKALQGKPMPENAWELVFNPSYTRLLKTCGIAMLDAPTEVVPAALHYLGKPAFSTNADDLRAASAMLAKVRPDVRSFSTTMIDDLASGKLCAALIWGGDVNIAASRAREIGSSDVIEALLPSTGGLMFIDSMAILKEAAHVKNAHAFIDYYLRAQVAAQQTNELSYVTGNKAALAHIEPAMANNKSIFLDASDMAKLVNPASPNNTSRAAMAEVFAQFKKAR